MKKIIGISFLLVFVLSSMTIAQEKRIPAKGLAVYEAGGGFKPYEFTRHAIGDDDILIETMYASICHSDLHHTHTKIGELKFTQWFPDTKLLEK